MEQGYTVWTELWGSFTSCSADFIGALRAVLPSHRGRLETGQQDAILPHSGDVR